MNFFKKALIATAVAGTFGTVHAADLTDAVTASSIQGVEIATALADTSLRVIVREQLEAGDVITLVFGEAVTGITSVTPGTASSGTGVLGIVYGSGTYTMGNATVATDSNGIQTVTLTVLTGDPVTLDSSFEVSVSGVDINKSKTAAATVTYSAVSGLTGDAKDTTGDNTGLLIRTENQYGSSVSAELNAVIQRSPQTAFISGYVTGNDTADTLSIKMTDNQMLLSKANGALVEAKVTVIGDFSTTAIAGSVAPVTGTTISVPVIATDKKSLSFTVTDTGTTGVAGTYVLTLDHTLASGKTIKASSFTTTVSVDASTSSATNTPLVTLDKADSGVWKIDAAIINVPYFVVGKEGTASSVHFSNLGPKADVIVEAVSVIDAAGDSVVYKAVDLGFDLAADSVTKVSQGAIISALGIPAGTQKLSVTFNIDGKASDVSAYAFTQTAEGRSEISNSQQK